MKSSKSDFLCPDCGHLFRGKSSSLIGRSCACKYCGAKFIASAIEPVLPAAAAAEQSPPIEAIAATPPPLSLHNRTNIILAVLITFALSGVGGFFTGAMLNKDATEKYSAQKQFVADQERRINEQKTLIEQHLSKIESQSKKIKAIDVEKAKLAELAALMSLNSTVSAYTETMSYIFNTSSLKGDPSPYFSLYSKVYDEILKAIADIDFIYFTEEQKYLMVATFVLKNTLSESVLALSLGDGVKFREHVKNYTLAMDSVSQNLDVLVLEYQKVSGSFSEPQEKPAAPKKTLDKSPQETFTGNK